jgi:hypothetical protein
MRRQVVLNALFMGIFSASYLATTQDAHPEGEEDDDEDVGLGDLMDGTL